ncbi:hypothetical protein [Actinopolymorpha alba]|uniref:hypothetical protein n=1 Tax=Actinopolymorpha alba TaxID=533267 RepID=UPI00036F2836|nr:hypothetical protein [Actinopolymorpha alba]
MEYTLLQAYNTTPGDLEDAIKLLAPDWVGGSAIDHTDFWVTVPMTEAAARTLAPLLAPLVGVRIVTVTVDADHCRLSLTRPDAAPIGPVDGRSTEQVAELATALGKKNGAELAGVLASPKPPAERHRDAAGLLGLPFPDTALRGRAGVLVAWAPATTVRNLLPVEGHGAWVVPHGPNACLVVADGSGWAPHPGTFSEAFTAQNARALPSIGLSWGQDPTLWLSGDGSATRVELTTQDPKNLASAAAGLASVVGRPDVESDASKALSPGRDPTYQATDLLRLLGVSEVPAGAPVEELAAWAASQEGAVRVEARAGTSLSLRHADPSALASTFRHRRTIRRVRKVLVLLAVVAGFGLVFVVSERHFGWALPAAGALAVLLVSWVLLKRLLPPAGSRTP